MAMAVYSILIVMLLQSCSKWIFGYQLPNLSIRRTDIVWSQSSNPLKRTISKPFVRKTTDKAFNGDHIRACYFTNWSQYRSGIGKYVPEDYQPGLCTHILFAFGWMNEDYAVKAYDPGDESRPGRKGMYERINDLKRLQPGLKTLLSIGGWSFGTRLFEDMARSKRNRERFINSATKFLRLHDFDGLDIDWEYPVGSTKRKNYVKLLEELHLAFRLEAATSLRSTLLLTAAVSAGKNTIDQAYDVMAMSKYLNFIMVMTYDFHGAWENVTGLNSPLYSRGESEEDFIWNMDFAAEYWVSKGMLRSKIVIGVATYGRGWTLADSSKTAIGSRASGPSRATPYVNQAGIAAYYELCRMLWNGGKRHWDDNSKVPYLVNGDQWFTYDDQQSIRFKAEWIKSNGFRGAMVWALDFDDFSGNCPQFYKQKYPLANIIREVLPGKEDVDANWHTIFPTEARTTTTSATTDSYQTTTRNYCEGRRNGYHLSSRCGAYTLCLNGRPFILQCPSGLQFDSIKGHCDYPLSGMNCEAESIPASTSTLTPQQSSATPVINHVVVQTLVPVHSGVDRYSIPATTTTARPRVPNAAVQCNTDGFYRHGCTNAFHRCVHGHPYIFYCHTTLVLNTVTQICDYPINVDGCNTTVK